jgi:hypothetical protein
MVGMVSAAALGTQLPASAGGPTASVQAEYLLIMHANLSPPQAVDQSLLIVNVPAGGSVDGPRIKGKLLGPSGDWLRVMPSGVFRLDVRATIQTDDNELIRHVHRHRRSHRQSPAAAEAAGQTAAAPHQDCHAAEGKTAAARSQSDPGRLAGAEGPAGAEAATKTGGEGRCCSAAGTGSCTAAKGGRRAAGGAAIGATTAAPGQRGSAATTTTAPAASAGARHAAIGETVL